MGGAEPREPEDRTCPSARCEEGATVLGVVGPTGVGYLTPMFMVDAEFIREARRRGVPERAFRFAGPCVEDRCAQWTGTRCGIIEEALQAQDAGSVPTLDLPLPRCGIRATCRWFHQAGARACAVCPLVMTDGRSGERSVGASPAGSKE